MGNGLSREAKCVDLKGHHHTGSLVSETHKDAGSLPNKWTEIGKELLFADSRKVDYKQQQISESLNNTPGHLKYKKVIVLL